MPRQPRIEYEGAIYHVMNRGDRREDIVHGEADRKSFVQTLGETCARCGWEVHAWCLMSNHFHLVVETPHGNLVTGMKWFLGTYTIRFNARHRLRGHLFAGRYKSLVVDDADHHYLRKVSDYVHLNPARAGLIDEDAALETYPWSSYGDYLRAPEKRPDWLRMDRVLGEHGIPEDNRSGRLEFARRMEAIRNERDTQASQEGLLKGWRLGSEEFVARILDQIEGKTTVNHSAIVRAEVMNQRAERLIAEGLAKEGWTASRLIQERKGHPVKVALAKRLRSETTVTLAWIANRLHMGRWTYVSSLLRQCQ